MQQIELNYINRQTKLDAYEGLLSAPWSMLLDSAGSDLAYNRYDILVNSPSVTLSFNNNEVNLTTNSNHLAPPLVNKLNSIAEQFSEHPLILMRKINQCFNQLMSPTHVECELPFVGGWLGYLSYDFGEHLEKFTNTQQDDIQIPTLAMGFYQWALINDHQLKTSTLYNFGLPESAWQELTKRTTESLALAPFAISENTSANNHFKLTSQWQSNISAAEYKNAFTRIQNYIKAGDCYQVNFAQRFKAQFQGNSYSAYKKLSLANQAPFSAYLKYTDFEILCLSPERFLECNRGKVITQPIKGTRPRSDNQTKDRALADELTNSEKDRAENLMIVDLLRNDLSRTAAKASVKVSQLFGLHSFKSVHHLISTIESQLAPQFDIFDLLSTSFPGGSITGAPKIRAMQIIFELEPHKRNLYCGSIGYIDINGKMDTNICIRTLISKQKNLYCWAGGGLVADSSASSEYQETFDKLAKILPILEAEI
ncbi:aminodeoxychorismate synthase component I [Aliikangiella sp. IMCC44653]